jgi:hypothetical protein
MNILIAINPQHKLTPEQLNQLEPHTCQRLEEVDSKLAETLSNIQDNDVEMGYWKLACSLINIGDDYDAVILPISSPAFMFRLALELGLSDDPHCLDKYYFAHSDRVVIEQRSDDGGEVQKKTIFQHRRFFNLRGKSLSRRPILLTLIATGAISLIAPAAHSMYEYAHNRGISQSRLRVLNWYSRQGQSQPGCEAIAEKFPELHRSRL